MNPETLLTKAETAIKNQRTSGTGKYYLTIIEGEIVCLPILPEQRLKNIIRKLTEEDIEKGFTPKSWDELAVRLFREVERIKKCQTHHKP